MKKVYGYRKPLTCLTTRAITTVGSYRYDLGQENAANLVHFHLKQTDCRFRLSNMLFAMTLCM